MDSTSHFQSLVVDIEHEHRDLQRRLNALKHLADQPIASDTVRCRLEELGQALHQFRATMEAHFHKEESGGIIDEAVARLPRLASNAIQIEREHPKLLGKIDEAIRAAEVTAPDDRDWTRARAAVNEFVAKMQSHERAENRLLQQGFNQDLGANDL